MSEPFDQHPSQLLPPPRKSLGQHFLRDQHILQRIVRCAHVNEHDLILEVGPGRGALTEKLVTTAGLVVAIELDHTLAAYLREKFSSAPFIVHQADITQCDLATCLREAQNQWQFTPAAVRVVANLPYNMSTPILEYLIQNRDLFTDFTLMLQREVVERITSPPGNKTYGYFSVFVQAYCTTQYLFDVPPQAFFPPPKVWSSVIKLTPRATPLVVPENNSTFRKIISVAFSQRRKMIGKTLLAIANRETLEAAFHQTGLTPQQRPETVSVQEFAQLAQKIRQL